uniref:Uncharacterized protein n=1 Tax=Ciona savignyi TaxID=51511 RepID=H2Z0Y9_CIOSA
MAIEGNKSQKTKKRGFGRPPTGKLGIKTPGSSVVGSRLACNTLSSSPAQSLLGQRGSLAYRSLPRPSKSNLTPDKNQHSPLTNGTLGRDNCGKGGETFKRSPSLQKLLGLASRKQSTCTTSSTISNPHVTFSQSSTYIEVTSSVTSSVTPSMTSSQDSYTTPNKMELNSYNSLGRPRTASPRNGNINTSPLSYMSLPRRS